MKWKIAVVLLSAALVLALLQLRSSPNRPDLPSVVLQVKRLQKLVTVRYRLQRIVSMTEQKQPLGEESLLLMVQGEALAGVDLASLTDRDITFSQDPRRPIRIRLPQPQIQTVYLDERSTKVWDRRVTWWTPWVPFSPDLETRARQKAVDDMRQEALQMGILQQAATGARSAIRNLLAAFQIQVDFEGDQT